MSPSQGHGGGGMSLFWGHGDGGMSPKGMT
jgi:hypothetical protein